MNRFYKPLLALGCGVLLGCGAMSAAQADPTPRPMMQPDGSVVVLSLVGDEVFNCLLTPEGYPVEAGADGFYYFVDNAGQLTSFRVSDGVPASIDAASSFAAYRDANRNMAFVAAREAAVRGSRHHRVDKLGNSKWDNTDGHDLREVITEGEFRIPVILVNFKDVKFSTKEPHAAVDAMLNEKGYSTNDADGSVFDFYNQSSCGQFSPRFEVYGPVTLSKNEIEYVTSDPSDTYPNPEDPDGKPVTVYPAGRMVEEACRLLDGEIDFSQYDGNNDGTVDFVYFFFAGQSATTGGDRNRTIWPHAFTLTAAIGVPIELDGVQINRYCCSGELNTKRKLSGIGTFTHEFGHVLGFPDLYDTSNNNGRPSPCFSPGTYSTMDAGNYNNQERTPPHFSSYERYGMEWMKPALIDGAAEITLLPLGFRNFAYKVETQKPQEYFLLEARAPYEWDRFLEGHGLLVWHIDFDEKIWSSGKVNNNENHQCVDIVEADDIKTADSRDGDVFPGSQNICEFIKDQSPMFVDWSRRSIGLSLYGISVNPDGSVTFRVESENGKEMEGGRLEAPAVAMKSVGSDKAEIFLREVEGADGYMISVYEMKDFDGAGISKFVDGYCYREVKPENGAVAIEGLAPGVTYGVTAYALSPVNASRTAVPLQFTTQGESFETAAPTLFHSWEEQGMTLSWDAVAGATRYDLTVATRKAGETAETVKYPFEGSRLGEGWTGNGRFENRDKYVGEAAPSYNLNSGGAFLETPSYERAVKNISFWHCVRFTDGEGRLDVYGRDAKGNLRFIRSISELEQDPKGATLSIDMPSGIHSVRLVYTMKTTGLNIYIDDIAISLTDGFIDTPVEGYAARKVEDLSCLVTGLADDTPYVAYVVPFKGETRGMPSDAHYFVRTADKPAGVEGVTDDFGAGLGDVFSVSGGMVTPLQEDLCYSVYAVDGRIVARDITGSFMLPQRGVYIVRSGRTAAKINW